MKRFWTPDRLNFIRENLHLSDDELAVHFSTSKPAVKAARKKNGILRFIRNIFTPEENELIRTLYPDNRTDFIAKKLNRTVRSIYMQASNLGLKKSKEFLASPESGILTKGTQLGKATQFIKGHVPANKGVVMSPELREKVKHTWWTKGNKPHNTKADGVITTRTNKASGIKYKYIRIDEGHWEDLKRYMWEKANGSIPSGFNVVFKAENTGVYKLDNFELISNAELLERNTLIQWPLELQQVIKLNNKLKKQIHHGRY